MSKEIITVITLSLSLFPIAAAGGQIKPPVTDNNNSTRIAGNPIPHILSYVESSTGLDQPKWDTGGSDLELADLNGDGNPDLISVGDHGSPNINTNMHGISVWFGDGNGNWFSFQNGTFGYGGLAIGDVNNDGFLDVGWGVHHNYSSSDFGNQLMEVALGDGTGRNWIPWDDGLAQDGQSWGMFGTEFADVNADGFLDVASVSFGCCDGFHVYLNNNDGTWMHSFGFLNGNSDFEINSGDINNDGYPDFVIAHSSGTVWINDATGGFNPGDLNLPANGNSVRKGPDLGDVNRDGFDDLSFINSDGGLAVWLWDDDAGLWVDDSGNLPRTGNMETTRLVDMNGDGFLDLVAFGQGRLVVFTGNGSDLWTLASTFTVPSPGYYSSLVTGDADHNGFPDIAIVSEKEGGFFGGKNHLQFFRESSSPAFPEIKLTSPPVHRTLIAGSVFFVDWIAAVPDALKPNATVTIEWSSAGQAGPWTVIGNNLPNNGRGQFIVPSDAPAANAYLRITLITTQDNYRSLRGPYTVINK